MIVYVCGIAGVGKTTIANETAKLGQAINFKVERVEVHPILCKLAGVATAEQYRRLPEATRRTFKAELFRQVYAMDKADPSTVRLFDRHLTSWDAAHHEFKVREMLPDDWERLAAMVIVVAPSEVICDRRLRDHRIRFDRHLYPPSILEKIQEFEKAVAYSQAKTLKLPIIALENIEGGIPMVSRSLLAFVQGIGGE